MISFNMPFNVIFLIPIDKVSTIFCPENIEFANAALQNIYNLQIISSSPYIFIKGRIIPVARHTKTTFINAGFCSRAHHFV